MTIKKLNILFFTILIIVTNLFSQENTNQNLDSLFNEFLILHNIKTFEGTQIFSEDTSKQKCGFETAVNVRLNINSFNPKQKIIIQNLMQRPNLDASLVSPKHYFRIHYSSSGNDAPLYDINQFSIAADSAFDFEVNQLGFPPPKDNGDGGDNLYDIYIMNISNVYGYTQPENEITNGSNKYYTYMVIHNSFNDFFTEGINAAKVTVAHELFHGIQLSNYVAKFDGNELVDSFFYELNSTAMEDFVFPFINDYLGYMKGYFNNTSKAFAEFSGYELAVWNIFLQKKFGFNIIKRQWEFLVYQRALSAINNSLIEVGYNFGEAFSEFGIWTYFTNYRSISNKYFDDAKLYPIIKPMQTISFSPPRNDLNLKPTSNTFLKLINNGNNDTLYSIITNSDVQNGINNPTSTFSIEYDIYNYEVSNSEFLTNNYFKKVNTTNPIFWLTSEILNNEIVKEGISTPPSVDFYPSPFVYNKNQFISFKVEEVGDGFAELYIFSSAMNLVYKSKLPIQLNKKICVWNVLKENGEKLNSGVYIYYIKTQNKEKKGKLVIIND
ncbi:MAG: hypothetical protein STSR0008_11680 [Ignavibacterium sp.]